MGVLTSLELGCWNIRAGKGGLRFCTFKCILTRFTAFPVDKDKLESESVVVVFLV